MKSKDSNPSRKSMTLWYQRLAGDEHSEVLEDVHVVNNPPSSQEDDGFERSKVSPDGDSRSLAKNSNYFF